MVGDKLVDAVVRVGEGGVGGEGISLAALGLELLHDGGLIGHYAALHDGHVDAPFLMEDAVRLHKGRVAEVSVLGLIHFVAVHIAAVVVILLLVVLVAVFHQFLVPAGGLESHGEYLQIACLVYYLRQIGVGEHEGMIHHVDISVDSLEVLRGDEGFAVELYHSFAVVLLKGDRDVAVGEVGALYGALSERAHREGIVVIAAVDDGTEHEQAGHTVVYLSVVVVFGVVDGVDVLLYCLVGRGEHNIMAARLKQLCHRALGTLAQFDTIEQRGVYAEILIFAEDAIDSLAMHDVQIGFVRVITAPAQGYSRHNAYDGHHVHPYPVEKHTLLACKSHNLFFLHTKVAAKL